MKVRFPLRPVSANDAMAITLRQLRERSGDSQGQLADRLKWPQARLSRMELGTQFWTVIDIWEVAEAFGMKPSELVQRATSVYRTYKAAK